MGIVGMINILNIFVWDLGVIFLGILNFKILRFLKNFFNLGLKGAVEKYAGCFLVHLFLGGFFRLKSVKKCVCVVGLKIVLLLLKSVFINLGEGMSKLWRWVAAKHTTHTAVQAVRQHQKSGR